MDNINLNLTVTEVYNCLCDCGKERMQELVKKKMADEVEKRQQSVKEKLADKLAKQALEGEPKTKDGGKS